MDPVAATARQWLDVAGDLGWGIEGPAHGERITQAMRDLASGTDPSSVADLDLERELGMRPVDALFAAARLLLEAALTDGLARREELVSGARGWLSIASRS